MQNNIPGTEDTPSLELPGYILTIIQKKGIVSAVVFRLRLIMQQISNFIQSKVSRSTNPNFVRTAADFHGMKINALYLFICRQLAVKFPHTDDDIHSQLFSKE